MFYSACYYGLCLMVFSFVVLIAVSCLVWDSVLVCLVGLVGG